MRIERCDIDHLDEWVGLRSALWPEGSPTTLRDEAVELLRAGESQCAVFLGRSDDGQVVGFAEARMRRDPVNGCDTSPVAFLEGIYVVPACRRQGLARSLCAAVEDWGRSHGCVEFGSDALIDNQASHAFHAALGFEERERVVYFRKPL